MLKYFQHLSLRLFFAILGILLLLTVWALAHGSPHVPPLLAANLAVALHNMGVRVGILDADLYGPSQPTMLGVATQQPEKQESPPWPTSP